MLACQMCTRMVVRRSGEAQRKFVVPTAYTLLARTRGRVAETPEMVEPAPVPQAAE